MFPQTLGWDELVKCMWGLCLVNLLNYVILLPKFNPEALLRTTHKSSTVVTESGLQVGGLLEVVRKTQAQLGVDGAGPHEVGRDLVSADEAFPASRWERRCEWGWVTRLLLALETLCILDGQYSVYYLTVTPSSPPLNKGVWVACNQVSWHCLSPQLLFG